MKMSEQDQDQFSSIHASIEKMTYVNSPINHIFEMIYKQ